MFDISGGTGALWSNTTKESSALGAGTVKAATTDSVYMREAIALGLRYSQYFPLEDAAYFVSFEISGTTTQPTINGKMKYSLLDSSDRTSDSYTEDLKSASAPGLGILRGSLHLGFHMPIDAVWAYELGMFGGLTGGKTRAEYDYSFPGKIGVRESGPSGLGMHAGIRLALQMIPTKHLTVSFEYRLTTEFFGSYALIPIFMSSGSMTTMSGHLLLISVGYRFGNDLPPESTSAGPTGPASTNR